MAKPWYMNWLYECRYCGNTFWPDADQDVDVDRLFRFGMSTVEMAQTVCPKCGRLVWAEREMGTEHTEL